MKPATTKRSTRSYVLCVHAQGDVDLEKGKVYEVLPDEWAAKHKYLRIIDESEEDYLYPASFFVPLDLPREAERALTARARPKARGGTAPRARAAVGSKDRTATSRVRTAAR